MENSKLFYVLTGASALTAVGSCTAPKEAQKPLNVVYIMCDDHSYQTISAYDRRYMETPNIDRLADEGARFTNSFVANSLSGPSRACMLTGKHSHATASPTTSTASLTGASRPCPSSWARAATRPPWSGNGTW